MHGRPWSRGVFAVLWAGVVAASVSLTAQTAPPESAHALPPSTWTAQTAWGDPDLQGIWSYATLTPLQRPAAMGDREFMTDAEIAARNEQSVTDRPAQTTDGANAKVGNYNRLWFDMGKASRRTSQIIDPPNGRLPAFTARGQQEFDRAKRLRDDDYVPASWVDLQTDDRCIMYHGVPPQPSGYNNTYQIFQSPGLVAILDENIHHVRLIPLGKRSHLPAVMQQWNGDSVGHWEGKTLVVETTNYSPKTELRFPQQMLGFENTRTVERLTRLTDGTIDYRFTVENADIFTTPFTVLLPLERTSARIYEYACHEGNYSIVNMLKGARAQDADDAKVAGKSK
jgi:hypothetical protein